MEQEMTQDCGKPIKGFSNYGITENGTVRNNWNGHELKPDKSGCVCIRTRGKNSRTKTFSIARLVAIHWLDMPDEPGFMAYLKDTSGGYSALNIAWGPKHDVLSMVHKRSFKKKNEWIGPEVIE